MSPLRDWIVLLSAPGLGPESLREIAGQPRRDADLLAAARALLARPERRTPPDTMRWLDAPDPAVLDRALAWLDAPDHHLITWEGDDYPPQLRRLARPPAALFVAGDPGALWLPQVAMVGSRHASRGGLDNARRFATALARAGLVVTSGLAVGIDGAAHTAALAAGGLTVAVAGTGLDQVYPARHAALAGRIRAQGALVSEFLPGTGPRPRHFPRRNRIIAGLAAGTLVVEAGLRSGSLITARHALQENREVFAVPGSIHNPLARGCHRLIKDGARLVESATDLLDELGNAVLDQASSGRKLLSPEAAPAPAAGAPDEDYRRLLDALGHDPVSLDQLVSETGLTVEVLSSMLLILELDGLVESGPGGSYCRIGENCR